MIRPVAFEFNAQTATNNHYQRLVDGMDPAKAQQLALAEFEAFSTKLKAEGVNVIIVHDTIEPHTPDSIFPNNWISFHESGMVVLYPMCAENRRAERREDVLDILRSKGFRISEILDYSGSEQDGLFLEGTGSMVLDRENLIVYACLSIRTDETMLNDWAEQLGYRVVCFDALQMNNGKLMPIYHTNVMMSVGKHLAVVCAESVRDETQQQLLLNTLKESGKEIILISEEQKSNFAGNMLEVVSDSGKPLMVMSSQAFASLEPHQIEKIEQYDTILHSPLDTIEALGGGSARCMMAEVFLPKPNT